MSNQYVFCGFSRCNFKDVKGETFSINVLTLLKDTVGTQGSAVKCKDMLNRDKVVLGGVYPLERVLS